MAQRIVVLGAGFAGLWSAIGAARALDELGVGADKVEIVGITSIQGMVAHQKRERVECKDDLAKERAETLEFMKAHEKALAETIVAVGLLPMFIISRQIARGNRRTVEETEV